MLLLLLLLFFSSVVNLSLSFLFDEDKDVVEDEVDDEEDKDEYDSKLQSIAKQSSS
jgi:hypothetical protein